MNNIFIFMLRTLWRYAGTERWRLRVIYPLFAVANIIFMLQPIALAQIIHAGGRHDDAALRDALIWAAAYAGMTFGFWLLHGPARIIERRLANHVERHFILDTYRKITEMPLRWHQDHHTGNTVNRVLKASKALFLFTQDQFVIIQPAVRFAASLGFMAWYSWWVALAALLCSIGIIFAVRGFDRKLVPLIHGTNEQIHRVNAALVDYIGNIITVLTLRLQDNTAGEVKQRLSAIKPLFWAETMVNEKKWFVFNMLLTLAQAGILGLYIAAHLGSRAAVHGALDLGAVVAIFQYLLMINFQFFHGAFAYENLLYRYTEMRGVDELLQDHARLSGAAPSLEQRPWHHIAIAHLHFRHNEGEDELHTLRDVSFSIGHGEKIALIGGSGAGKTTLLTLLRGLYEAPQVELTLSSGNIADNFANLSPLAAFTTLVPQDSEIFENTVRYNLTLGTEVPAALLEQALRITTFDTVAEKLPHGLDTDIRERGVNLSGGQKQRLALARGLIAAAGSSLLLLDEPTSSVDLPTEGQIFDRLLEAFHDKAILASIHRLHLLPRFDRIIYMQDGEIVEQGSFAALMEKRGAVHALWQNHLAGIEPS
jgi:ABC-type multidrug transport system fused ATPase/permease subunit